MARPAAFTEAEQRQRYLRALAKLGTLTAGCRAAKCSPHTIYKWREHDETFSLEEREANIIFCDRLEEEVYRRAVEGVRRLRFGRDGLPLLDPDTGKPYVEVEYSDALLMFRLKALRPEVYRERFEHSGPTGESLPTVREIVYHVPPGYTEDGPVTPPPPRPGG